jgi:hypothetical protein
MSAVCIKPSPLIRLRTAATTLALGRR